MHLRKSLWKYEIESDSFRNDLHTKWNVLSICIPVLFIGEPEFYWFIRLLSGVSGGLTLTLNFAPALWCQLFAMSLPDICTGIPGSGLPGLATVSQAGQWHYLTFTWGQRPRQSQFRHQTCNISSSSNFIVTFSLQKLTIGILGERSIKWFEVYQRIQNKAKLFWWIMITWKEGFKY